MIISAEMGEHFNILEYADPELDALAGEKTNILDSLDLVEPEPDKDDKKENKSQYVTCLKGLFLSAVMFQFQAKDKSLTSSTTSCYKHCFRSIKKEGAVHIWSSSPFKSSGV